MKQTAREFHYTELMGTEDGGGDGCAEGFRGVGVGGGAARANHFEEGNETKRLLFLLLSVDFCKLKHGGLVGKILMGWKDRESCNKAFSMKQLWPTGYFLFLGVIPPHIYICTLRHSNWENLSQATVQEGGSERCLPSTIFLERNIKTRDNETN